MTNGLELEYPEKLLLKIKPHKWVMTERVETIGEPEEKKVSVEGQTV